MIFNGKTLTAFGEFGGGGVDHDELESVKNELIDHITSVEDALNAHAEDSSLHGAGGALDILEETEKDIFPEQDVAFVYAENFNCFASAFPNGTFVLTEGAEYKVLWEETVYTCTAFYIESMGATAIGNTVAIGGEDNGLPFAIGSDSNGGVTIFSFDQTTKKVRIYQNEGYKIKESYIPSSIYAQIDKRIEDYINAAIGGDY